MKDINVFLIEASNNIYVVYCIIDKTHYILQVSAISINSVIDKVKNYFDNNNIVIKSIETDDVLAYNYDDIDDYANNIKNQNNIDDIKIIDNVIK